MKKILLLVALCCISSSCRRKVESIAVDGSSTVYPITEAIAEEFRKNNNTRITIAVSGTGGGFKKFCAGEVLMVGASRPIHEAETLNCVKNKVQYIELPVAYDGIAIVVNKQNYWVNDITTAELKKMWEPSAQKKVLKWNEVRSNWESSKFNLYGAGVDSGTYDYFTKAITGVEHSSRGDFTSSEDDNVLVQGVSRNKNALGFFGLAYYTENADKLKLVPVDDGDETNGKGAIHPTFETITNGTYQPLSRPLFIYVSKAGVHKLQFVEFVRFYLNNASRLAKSVGYVSMPADEYYKTQRNFDRWLNRSK